MDQLRSANAWTREQAAASLAGLAPAIEAAVPALAAAMGDPLAGVRWNAAKALGNAGPKAQAAVPALAKALKTEDWTGNVQAMSAWALYRIGPAAREAIPALVEALRDSHPMVRRETARALGAIGAEAKAALPSLEGALKDENGFVRVAAAAALWHVGQDARGIPLLIEALKDQTIVGTRVAADALAELGPGAGQAVPSLIAALKDPALCAQVAAARALWLVAQSAEGAPVLMAALGAEDSEVQNAAADTLRLIERESKATVPGLAEALRAFGSRKPAAPAGPQPLVFEAEEWTGPADAILRDKDSNDKWKFATNDRRWSRNTVLVSPVVRQDRATPEEGAPVLHTHVTGVPKGSYVVTIAHARPVALSLDEGKTWKKLDAENTVGTFEIKGGAFDLWVDDRYADSNSIGGSYYDYLTFTPAVPRSFAPVQGWAKRRVRERLDRGLTAMPLPSGGVYLSWRLLTDDPKGVAFDVYRRGGGRAARRVNEKPITRTTDFVDRSASAGAEYQYSVVLAGKPQDRVASPPVVVRATSADLAYLPIKLQGNYSVQKVGIGDLDGDGKFDYVIKQPEYNIDPYYTYWQRSPETYKLEAYRADGKFLWRHDLGWGIELGMWFSPYVVYDLDGDGRAEVACKAADADPRNAEGKVVSGPEYVALLDGLTGKVRCRASWPSRDGFTGESAHNMAARNQLGLAYLDGKTPCLLVERGTYGLQKLVAYQLRGNRLEQLWSWDNRPDGALYQGQGAHTLHAADVDADGRDEVLLGSSVLDDNGTRLWSTGLGHPDNFYVGEIDPLHPGLEMFYNIEPPRKENGFCLVDARTGKVLWGLREQSYHMGAGIAADIDPTHPGCECWAAEDRKGRDYGSATPPRWLYSAQGELLARDDKVPGFGAAAVYWDGDPQRELIQGSQVRDYQGGVHPPGLSGRALAIADVAGDWREEIITSVPGELRIYQTSIPASDRHVCLMQDPVYRLDIVAASQGYYAIPMTSVCFAELRPSVALIGPPYGLSPEDANPCAALVAAPIGRSLDGNLTLVAGEGATVDPTRVPLHVAAGKAERFPFRVRLSGAPSPLTGRVFVSIAAMLRTGRDNGMETNASLPVMDRPLSGVPLVEAEDFTEQSSGEVHIRTDKPGSSGKAFSHWDSKGHRLTWRITVPQSGGYHLVIRYACGVESERSLLMDGKIRPGTERLHFPPSGGLGGTAGDWAHLAIRGQDRKLAMWQLPAGPHLIAMENLDGHPLNLDYLALVPAGQQQ